VLFVHFKLNPRDGKWEHLDVSLAQTDAAISEAFAGADDKIYIKFDGQSLFVEQDSGFPYLLKMLEQSRRFGLQFVVCEVSQTVVTLLEGRPELREWLDARGINVRYTKAANPPATSTP